MALEVHQLTLGFPDLERYGLAEQMRRASKSIPANIAEGYGVQTQRNFARFLSQALGSSAEMGVHVDFATWATSAQNSTLHCVTATRCSANACTA